MKYCPKCSGQIIDEAIKCKHCGSWLKSYDDMISGTLSSANKEDKTDPVGVIVCPACHIDIHADMDMDELRRISQLKEDEEYICPKCKGDIIISHDRKIHLINRNKLYDAIYYGSAGLLVVGLILVISLGDSRVEKLGLDNVVVWIAFSPIIFGLGAQILQGISNGVILCFRYEVYKVKNPILFHFTMWLSILLWIFCSYILLDVTNTEKI